MSLLQTLALGIVRGYKKFLSPVMPVACRYVPTCSEYAEQAIAVHGTFRGSALALRRLARCHPLVRGGFDPVPHTHSYPSNEQRL